MNILVEIWVTKGDKDIKYSSTSGVQICWIKADILPLSFEVFIENYFRIAYIPEIYIKISQ